MELISLGNAAREFSLPDRLTMVRAQGQSMAVAAAAFCVDATCFLCKKGGSIFQDPNDHASQSSIQE